MRTVIVVTGADNGIGYHLTRALHDDGYNVAALDLSAENFATLQPIYPEQLLVFACDVTDSARVNDTISTIVEKWGRIESLTRKLALEFEKYGICVNLFHPPLTNTRSAKPLGIPIQAMNDPARVGRNLAKHILSTKPVIASDFRTAVYLFFAYRYPLMLGRLFAKLTESARSEKV